MPDPICELEAAEVVRALVRAFVWQELVHSASNDIVVMWMLSRLLCRNDSLAGTTS